MGSRSSAILTNAIFLIFLFLAVALFPVNAVTATPPAGAITKKVVIVVPSEPDTLDLNSTKMLWNNVTVFVTQKNLSFTPKLKGGDAALVLLKNIKPAQ